MIDFALWAMLILFAAAVIVLGLLLGVEPDGVSICPRCDNVMTELPRFDAAVARAICPTCGFRERRHEDLGADQRRATDKEKS